MTPQQTIEFLNETISGSDNTKKLIAKRVSNYLRKKRLDGTVYYSDIHKAFYLDPSINLSYKL